MKSRMDKYYDSNDIKTRTAKNQQLYRTIYEETEYSNVDGISTLKDGKIDIDMIRKLVHRDEIIPEKKESVEVVDDVISEESKVYDIKDILSKAKDNRVMDEERISDTKYNILKDSNLEEDVISTEDMQQDDLKSMIDRISSNSKGYTTNLLDDLKSIYDPDMHTKIEDSIEEKAVSNEIDNSFYTSKMGFKEEDFEDMQDDVEGSNLLTKILIVVLSLIIVVGIVFLVFHFIN